MKERRRAIRRRLGPIGMSLIASALTAAAFAAFSIAADSGGGGGNTSGGAQTLPAPPPGARGNVVFGPRLSAADRQKMEQFHQCMQQNGAPDPPRIDPSQGPPKPPSADQQQQIQKAYEACKDKLPQDLQNAGPPHIGVGPCPAPPPGAPAQPNQGSNQHQGQSNQSGTQPGGSSS